MNRIVDLAFIFDLVFTFFTPYTKEDGTIVDEKKDIAVEYAKSWLFPDFIACVPYDLIAYYSNSEDVSKLKIMRGLRLLKLTNMVRILRAGRMFRRYEAENDVNYSALGIYKFSFFILFLAHWMACVWYCITWLDEREVSWVTSYFDSMQSDGTTTTIPDGTLYLASLYWAVATLSTLGYGDVIPQTNAERMFSILCTFMGGAIYAYLLGSVCAIISHLDESSNTFYRQMDALNSFMKEKNLRDDLRVRLRDFFRFRRNSRGIVEWSNVMHLMSDALRLEVAEAVFGKWVRAMPLFEDAPKRLPDLLSAHLSSLVLSPQEDLMANPIRRECVFVIERGLIAHRGWIQPIGAMLGIERIYRDPSRMTFMTVSQPAITLCHSIVLSLNRNALLKVVDFLTLVPIRPRRRGERRSLRTFSSVVSLRPGSLAFNPDTPRRLPTPTDAFQLHPDVRSYGTTPRRCRTSTIAPTSSPRSCRTSRIWTPPPRRRSRARSAARSEQTSPGTSPSKRCTWSRSS